MKFFANDSASLGDFNLSKQCSFREVVLVGRDAICYERCSFAEMPTDAMCFDQRSLTPLYQSWLLIGGAGLARPAACIIFRLCSGAAA